MTDETQVDERPSKSERKREMHALQQLGEKLTTLSAAQLANVPLDDDLREALVDYQRFGSREARRRQLQYIGKLMRRADADAIEQAWQLSQAGSDAAKKQQHRLERWRDRLVAEGDAALDALLQEFPDIDRQPVRQLVRDAQKEIREQRPPAAQRKLFRHLKTII